MAAILELLNTQTRACGGSGVSLRDVFCNAVYDVAERLQR